MDAEHSRFVARRGDDAAARRRTADSDGLPLERRIVALLHGCVKRVHVDVKDPTHQVQWKFTYVERRTRRTRSLSLDKQRSADSARSAFIVVFLFPVYASVYLHHERSREGAPSRRQSTRRHLAVVSSGRENRRPRSERRGQELAAENHGR